MTEIDLTKIKAEWLTPRANETYALIIRLLAEEELSVGEVAERLGMTVRQVEKRRVEFVEEIVAQQQGAVLPALDDEEFEVLRSTVEEFGQIFVPVIRNKRTGNLLDGGHRTRLAESMGVELPVHEVDIPVEKEHAAGLAINVARRHLSRKEKQKLAVAELLHDPTQSNRAIAEKIGVAPNTVQAARKRLLERTASFDPTTRVGKDGRTQQVASESRRKARVGTAQVAQCPDSAENGMKVLGVTEARRAGQESQSEATPDHDTTSETDQTTRDARLPSEDELPGLSTDPAVEQVHHVEQDLLALLIALYSELPEEWRREEIDELLVELDDVTEGAGHRERLRSRG